MLGDRLRSLNVCPVHHRGRAERRREKRCESDGSRSPTEIVADALGCIDAGATIVHNHNDEYLWAEGGVHSAALYIEAWGPILDHTGRDIAKYLGVSRATSYRYLVHDDGAGVAARC
jgi:hypothetical protein